MGLEKGKRDDTRLIAKLQSIEPSSKRTHILIDKINPDIKWKVIGFLKSINCDPMFDADSNDISTILTIDVSTDFTKDILRDKITSYVQSIGVDDVSVSYSATPSSEFQNSNNDNRESEFVIDTDYDIANSDDIENIVKEIEAGNQSEFELVLSNPEDNEREMLLHRGQRSNNVITSLTRSGMGQEVEHSIIEAGMPVTYCTSSVPYGYIVNEVATQTIFKRRSTWARFFTQLGKLFRRGWEKVKNVKRFFLRSESHSCCHHCISNGTRSTCSQINTFSDVCTTSSLCSGHSKKKVSQFENDRLTMESYTQTENIISKPPFKMKRIDCHKCCRTTSLSKQILSSHTASLSDTREETYSCHTCTSSSSCCHDSPTISKGSESQGLTSITHFTTNILPLLRNHNNLKHPVYYVVPEDISTKYCDVQSKIENKTCSTASENGTKTSTSTSYSLSSNSHTQEKESTKEKMTLYIKKGVTGKVGISQRKTKSVKQIRIINRTSSSPVYSQKPMNIVKKDSEVFQKCFQNEDVEVDESINVLGNKMEVERTLRSVSEANIDRLLLQKQFEELNKKLDQIASLRQKKINESIQCILEESLVKTVDIGIGCKQLVDVAVECVGRVDAYSEYIAPEHSSENEGYQLVQERSTLDANLKLNNNDYMWSIGDTQLFHRDTMKSVPFSDGRPRDKAALINGGNMNGHEHSTLSAEGSPISRGQPYNFQFKALKNEKKKKMVGCSLLNSLFGGINNIHKKELLKHEKEIIEMKQLLSEINDEIQHEITAEADESGFDDDSDEEEDIHFWFSTPNHVKKKTVTFKNPLTD